MSLPRSRSSRSRCSGPGRLNPTRIAAVTRLWSREGPNGSRDMTRKQQISLRRYRCFPRPQGNFPSAAGDSYLTLHAWRTAAADQTFQASFLHACALRAAVEANFLDKTKGPFPACPSCAAQPTALWTLLTCEDLALGSRERLGALFLTYTRTIICYLNPLYHAKYKRLW